MYIVLVSKKYIDVNVSLKAAEFHIPSVSSFFYYHFFCGRYVRLKKIRHSVFLYYEVNTITTPPIC